MEKGKEKKKRERIFELKLKRKPTKRINLRLN